MSILKNLKRKITDLFLKVSSFYWNSTHLGVQNAIAFNQQDMCSGCQGLVENQHLKKKYSRYLLFFLSLSFVNMGTF